MNFDPNDPAFRHRRPRPQLGRRDVLRGGMWLTAGLTAAPWLAACSDDASSTPSGKAPYPLARPEDLDGFYVALRKVGADGVFVPMHPWFRANIMQGIAAQFLKMRLPAIAASDGFVEAGGLMAFGPNFDMRRRADQVVRVLKGANPADLAVELPTTFELFVNMTTAKAFGLTVPPSLKLRADKLIR